MVFSRFFQFLVKKPVLFRKTEKTTNPESKEPKEIISGICKVWISIFGPPKKFLTNNGGEFANLSFLDLAESMNIRVLTTAYQHNAVLTDTLSKIQAEQKTDIETALAWAIHAKYSSTNVHGFAPVQLAIGYLPQVPNVFNNKLPAMEEGSSQDILKLAREAFNI